MGKLHVRNHIIVVCSQNFNGYGILRSLAKAGVKPSVITNLCPKNPVVKLSRYRKDIHYYQSVKDIPSILIDNFSKISDVKPIVICCDDALQSVVDCNYNNLSKYFILSNINHKQGEITRLMDKNIQMEIASECGVTVPLTWDLEKDAVIPDDMQYPCIVKAKVSIHGSKEEMRICRNESDLKQCLSTSGHLVQQFIEKDYEIIIYGTSIDNGNYYMAGVTRKIRQYPDDNGMSSFCVLENFDRYPNLDIQAIKRFLKKLNYTGMFSIEMAVKDNQFYLLEINLRNDGKQYFSTAAGANLPKLYIQSILNQNITIPTPKYPTYAMGELTDFYQIKRLPNFTFGHYIKDLIKTDSFFILNISDPLPGISDCLYHLRFKIRGLLKRIGFNIN